MYLSASLAYESQNYLLDTFVNTILKFIKTNDKVKLSSELFPTDAV